MPWLKEPQGTRLAPLLPATHPHAVLEDGCRTSLSICRRSAAATAPCAGSCAILGAQRMALRQPFLAPGGRAVGSESVLPAGFELGKLGGLRLVCSLLLPHVLPSHPTALFSLPPKGA